MSVAPARREVLSLYRQLFRMTTSFQHTDKDFFVNRIRREILEERDSPQEAQKWFKVNFF